MDTNASALENPQAYVENHPPILLPLVTCTALMLFKRLRLAWLLLTLLSLVFLVWRLARGQVTNRRMWLVWILVVIILGPFGLLAYPITQRRQRAQDRQPGE